MASTHLYCQLITDLKAFHLFFIIIDFRLFICFIARIVIIYFLFVNIGMEFYFYFDEMGMKSN